MGQHQRERLAFAQPFLVAIGQFAKGGARTVEQGFPAELIAPPLELVLGNALGLVVMKTISHPVAVEPGAGLLHGVAVLDAVDGDGQGRSSGEFPE
jgi:hypothetical protein